MEIYNFIDEADKNIKLKKDRWKIIIEYVFSLNHVSSQFSRRTVCR